MSESANQVAGAVVGEGAGAVISKVGGFGGRAIAQAGERFAYNAVESPGPLANLPGNPAANFASGKYNSRVLADDLVLYRAGEAGTPLGQWFTREPAASRAQVRIDLAVKPQWIDPKTGVLTGSSNLDTVFAVKIPCGTRIYEGPVGYQSGIYLGGTSTGQIFVEAPWKIKGVEVVGALPLK